jgi:hypothetical protein
VPELREAISDMLHAAKRVLQECPRHVESLERSRSTPTIAWGDDEPTPWEQMRRDADAMERRDRALVELREAARRLWRAADSCA